MAVILSTGKERNWVAVNRRVTDSAWFGTTNNSEQAPLALSNEYIEAVNAAGTGTVNLIKADANDSVHLASGRGMFFNNPKTIVDGSATSLYDVACPANSAVGGAFFYQVIASDGTDFQTISGMVTYGAVNKAGTLTLTITEVAGNQAKAVSAGTLTLAWTFVTGASKGTIKLTPTGSLTETLYTVTTTLLPATSGTITQL